ncbi:hydro-lyase family enzyme, Fe-S type, tartrate/fumarate subfamily [Desulfosporosinus acidiphilus SJ4]|uniref:Hydro-lyase family enzyme, Fe-S type, tartrate/fumarate subfamily n=1 Tax=Desulfosporosinus acidiphilus (strain DSM 22704 / JCM 16185 / SJ4) TaxID=646529 RepID=I4D098_DESAJ|nr:Fe-S-containing hydro-lyase [Desulfosporosinus acidiphilus]AFM39222.1 hydro-lyase family enzyme, Fe-S type, tartrate/fumarate subfamily [Desulfosporosinus acidiphilus SJ4]
MSKSIRIETPLTKEKLKSLKAGDSVLISGVIYTGRDAAHKKMIEALAKGADLPFSVNDQIIYFVGPTPAKEGQVIGSAGPTTSGRMDAYSPTLIAEGLTGMIGKGLRSPEVIDAMKEHSAVYFGAIGGAGAIISKCIVSAEIIAYPELGTEAVRRLTVKDFPVIVVIDCYGNNLYEIGKAQYRSL